MESLESRLERLSPEQRREVEDFVEFLLQRTSPQGSPANPPHRDPPQALAAAPPVLTAQEPAPDPQLLRVTSFLESPGPAPRAHEADPATQLIQEIASERDDILTTEYMDYGRFEVAPVPAPTPATEAVRRIKERLSGKKPNAPVRDGLDWID